MSAAAAAADHDPTLSPEYRIELINVLSDEQFVAKFSHLCECRRWYLKLRTPRVRSDRVPLIQTCRITKCKLHNCVPYITTLTFLISL
jgi:hypothetical protein